MNRREIEKVLEKKDQTILDFPDRGPWGDNRYRGNCSGWIHAFLIWKYKPQYFCELFSGSGTGYDVCQSMGVKFTGADLNPTPVRPGILCVNAFKDEVPEAFYGADMIFMHPPYGAEIKIPYAGSMYPDPTGELSKSDLGQMPWNDFMKALNEIVMKYYSSMKNGAYMSILMGDVRRNGLHSMFTDIVKPGKLEQVLIKTQNNCMSTGRSYRQRNFVPINHEYLMVLKKIMPYIIDFQLPMTFKKDIRDSKTATWADVVQAVLSENGGEADLATIYKNVDGHEKTKKNIHWKEKIRQTLQIHPNLFTSDRRGVWRINYAAA